MIRKKACFLFLCIQNIKARQQILTMVPVIEGKDPRSSGSLYKRHLQYIKLLSYTSEQKDKEQTNENNAGKKDNEKQMTKQTNNMN